MFSSINRRIRTRTYGGVGGPPARPRPRSRGSGDLQHRYQSVPELNAFEFEALRQIAAHPASHHVPLRVHSRLKDIGYVKEVLGGLVLTDDGLRRIAVDKRTSSPRAR